MRKYLLTTGLLLVILVSLGANLRGGSGDREYQIQDCFSGDIPSENYYNANQPGYGYPLNSPIQRALDDGKEDDFEGGGNQDREDSFVDAAPIGDGILVFILFVVSYISIILLRSLDRRFKIFRVLKENK